MLCTAKISSVRIFQTKDFLLWEGMKTKHIYLASDVDVLIQSVLFKDRANKTEL